jgi:hypothetical protein
VVVNKSYVIKLVIKSPKRFLERGLGGLSERKTSWVKSIKLFFYYLQEVK